VRRWLHPDDLARRLRQIDAARLERRLTDAEIHEADRLTSLLYMREWRKAETERERAFNMRSK